MTWKIKIVFSEKLNFEATGFEKEPEIDWENMVFRCKNREKPIETFLNLKHAKIIQIEKELGVNND